MRKLLIGIVDYGAGNLASVRHGLQHMGFNCRISNDPTVLTACDVLLLPGVGAFRPAMMALKANALDVFLKQQAALNKPIIGLCLGMQLMTDSSEEDGMTDGLGLIPGRIVSLGTRRWHIGWNTLESNSRNLMFAHPRDETYYFNHSFCYEGPEEFQMCTTHFGTSFAAIIQRDKTVGIQFHPEKSQEAGHRLLKQLIEGLSHA
ncbi:MAG: imidazole glycerol phosphate synthase subunit HisH [Pseudomonadota bacterium]